MNIEEQLRNAGVDDAMSLQRDKPLWDGPCSNTRNGGITFSLLNRYLTCPERFRIYTIEGIRPKDAFNKNLEYGNMWHICEEHHRYWEDFLLDYRLVLGKKYPLQQEEIAKWYNVCKIQFPIYMEYWDRINRTIDYTITSTISERAFSIPITLPSGRIVYLRGKQDGLPIIRDINGAGLYLQENKTKGDVDKEQIEKQLRFDLQTMLYICALYEDKDGIGNMLDNLGCWWEDWSIKGVLYNVIKRPLSGGKGSIVRHKATKNKPEESYENYYKRLRSIIDGSGEDAPGPDYFFARWKIDISVDDVMYFVTRCLYPLLENVCDDYEWWRAYYPEENDNRTIFMSNERKAMFPNHCPRHFIMPFGLYNALQEGETTYYDDYLMEGRRDGLYQFDNLFPELQT